MSTSYRIPQLPLSIDLETKAILKQVSRASRALAELKGVAMTIPNERILISTLSMQEAKDSSEVENIITTQDQLYQADADEKRLLTSAAEKEVLRYREALRFGFDLVKDQGLLTNSIIKEVQMHLEDNQAGFRTQAGTTLKDGRGNIVYTPPQHGDDIERYMSNLEQYINMEELSDVDPLIKMAVIHHQFESIHPFYDGNGRTGRIINVLYLVFTGLLDLPILYLSRYITRNKPEYYRLIQAVRDKNEDNAKEWEEWILFMLKGVEETAYDTMKLVENIGNLMKVYKQILRPLFGKNYKHELLNNLFYHPYTKIEFMQRDLMVQRKTAAKYLGMLVEQKLLSVIKVGRDNYYINDALVDLLMNHTKS